MSIQRKILYVTGTRADFGLMACALKEISANAKLKLSVVATGMHLLEEYGSTLSEIREAGLDVIATVPIDEGIPSGELMAKNIGTMTIGFSRILSKEMPDIVLLIGDRGEMLAAAIASIHLNIPIVHLHGGERSGTVDEPVRHAISKLSHFHFVATTESQQRLLRMGEHIDRIFITGAPGLDGIKALANMDKLEVCAEFGFDPDRKIALMLFHPVVQNSVAGGEPAEMILKALQKRKVQTIALAPNSDAGSHSIRDTLESFIAQQADFRLKTHLKREVFLSSIACADFMIGNSSSGIIEAATFGTPVVNVGPRQNLRQRNCNVIDCVESEPAISNAISSALAMGKCKADNVYGDGQAAKRIINLLASLDLGKEVLNKINAY